MWYQKTNAGIPGSTTGIAKMGTLLGGLWDQICIPVKKILTGIAVGI